MVVAASVDVAASGVLRVGGALRWSRGRRARRRLAEDDAPVPAAVPIVAWSLPAQSADPLDERRQCGRDDAGEGAALLGVGERDSAGLLFDDRGPERAVVNFCRIHKTLKMTPAMAAGLTSELRDVDWITGLVEARDPRPGPRGPYKPRTRRRRDTGRPRSG